MPTHETHHQHARYVGAFLIHAREIRAQQKPVDAERIRRIEDLIGHACADERRAGVARAVVRWCEQHPGDWIAQTVSTGVAWPFGVTGERQALDALVALVRTLVLVAPVLPPAEAVSMPGARRRRRANDNTHSPPRLFRVK